MSKIRLEASKAVLTKADAESRGERSKRLALIQALFFPTTSRIPSRTFALLSEAASCFVNGEYNGSICVLATAVEYSLRDLLGTSLKLGALVKAADERGLLNRRQAAVLGKLRQYRNNVIHSDLTELAKGIGLQVQAVTITEKGLIPSSDWSDVQPDDTAMQEIAGSLSAESTVRHILLDTRTVLCELYGGTVGEDA
ncbi:MAG: hypothetical protein A2Z75_04095 [Chloroflexi bacterium RBG_13_50_10]|nr:MAG: hypothetical protein A2Z75_04095 [Chloroflexi bacterium RBG_13_50_10]